jgi:riboflavin biosynthesis pyrimidine reductase
VAAGLDLDLLLKALSERQMRAILLEGGPTLAGSFLAAGLIDRVVAYIAPVLIGGGKPALAGPGAPNITDAKRFRLEVAARRVRAAQPRHQKPTRRALRWQLMIGAVNQRNDS